MNKELLQRAKYEIAIEHAFSGWGIALKNYYAYDGIEMEILMDKVIERYAQLTVTYQGELDKKLLNDNKESFFITNILHSCSNEQINNITEKLLQIEGNKHIQWKKDEKIAMQKINAHFLTDYQDYDSLMADKRTGSAMIGFKICAEQMLVPNPSSILVKAEHIATFSNFQDWVNKASSKTGDYRRDQKIICIDINGNTLNIGEDFMKADEKELFPVKAYRLIRTNEVN